MHFKLQDFVSRIYSSGQGLELITHKEHNTRSGKEEDKHSGWTGKILSQFVPKSAKSTVRKIKIMVNSREVSYAGCHIISSSAMIFSINWFDFTELISHFCCIELIFQIFVEKIRIKVYYA